MASWLVVLALAAGVFAIALWVWFLIDGRRGR